MPNQFRVVNLSPAATDQCDQLITAASPEQAGSKVLGMELVRSGAKADLIAKVYWQNGDNATNMVRLYRKVIPARVRSPR